MRSTRLVSPVSFGVALWFLLQSAQAVRAQNPSVGFSVNPNEFRVGQSAAAMLSVTSSSPSLTIYTGDKFTFIFDASVGAVSSVSPTVSVDSSSLTASDFSATSTATQVALSYNGAAKPFSFGSTIAVEVHFTAGGQVGTGKVSFSSRFTSSVNGYLLYTPVSIVDFANAGVTSVVHDPTLSGDGTSGSPLGVVAGSLAITTDATTLRGNGTTGMPLAVNAGSVAVATDATTVTGNGTTGMPLGIKQGSVAITTDATTLMGNGTAGMPLGVKAGSVSVATDATLTGNGTTVLPLGVKAGTMSVATDATLTGNGTTGMPLGVKAGSVSVATDATLTGNGTTGMPLGVKTGSISVATDATLTGNGTTGMPLGVKTGSTSVATDATLRGNGTTGSPLGVNPASVAIAADPTTLTGLGTAAMPLAVRPGGVAVTTGTTLTGNGTTGMPLNVAVPLLLGSSAQNVTGVEINMTGTNSPGLLVLGGGVHSPAPPGTFGAGGGGIFATGGDASGSGNLSGNGISVTGGSGLNSAAGNHAVRALGGDSDGPGGQAGDGLYAQSGLASNGAANGFAGYFVGDVHVSGNLSKSGGSFKIDHPLDPANKYLYHSFVESPDMKNIYDGTIRLDSNGEAVVELPGWFSALNKDFRYLLTPIGAPGPGLYIAEEIADNRFRIAGGMPGMRVSWLVTGIRQDAWADAHRIPVEEVKSDPERGHYIHPELFDQPEEKSIEWARHPELMKSINERREQRIGRAQAGATAPEAQSRSGSSEASPKGAPAND